MTQWLIGIFVRYLAPKMTYEDGKQCFLYLQPPTVSQTVGAVRGWENELFLIGLSSFSLPFLFCFFFHIQFFFEDWIRNGLIGPDNFGNYRMANDILGREMHKVNLRNIF